MDPSTIFNESSETTSTENVEVTETTSTEATSTENVEVSTENNHWYSGDEYSELASKYETQDALLKDYTNAQSLIGKKGILKPGEESTEEEWNTYYNDLGRPDEANKYELTDVENAPEWFDETAESFKQLAHDSGLSQTQANKLFDSYIESQYAIESKYTERVKQANIDCMSELKSAYGNDAERMISMASNVARDAGIVDSLKVSNLANDPKMVSLLADYAKLTGVASSPTSGIDTTIANGAGTITDQISTIRSNPAYGTDSKEGRALKANISQLYIRQSKGFK